MDKIINNMIEKMKTGEVGIHTVRAFGSIDGDELYIPDDEIKNVVATKLDLSSFDGGLLYWDEDTKCYHHQYHFSGDKVHIHHMLVEISKEDFCYYNNIAYDEDEDDTYFMFMITGEDIRYLNDSVLADYIIIVGIDSPTCMTTHDIEKLLDTSMVYSTLNELGNIVVVDNGVVNIPTTNNVNLLLISHRNMLKHSNELRKSLTNS